MPAPSVTNGSRASTTTSFGASVSRPVNAIRVPWYAGSTGAPFTVTRSSAASVSSRKVRSAVDRKRTEVRQSNQPVPGPVRSSVTAYEMSESKAPRVRASWRVRDMRRP